jgi:hypothetical protein
MQREAAIRAVRSLAFHKGLIEESDPVDPMVGR